MNPPPTSFHPGQVVQLKSGGPRMTVNHSYESGACHCTWFNGDELHWTQIHPAALVLATDDQPVPQQPSPLNSNTLCTQSFPNEGGQHPRLAHELQAIVSMLTATPTRIEWVPDPDPNNHGGWFEVSAPLKP